MTNKRFGLGVVLYVFNPDVSKILLLELNPTKKAHFKAEWGNVGGKVNLGESSLDCCIRETIEEIGITLQKENIRQLYVSDIPDFSPEVHAVQFVYGTKLSENVPIILSNEHASYRWFSISALPKNMIDSQKETHRITKIMQSTSAY